jgi:PAS domain S-box-containing protein
MSQPKVEPASTSIDSETLRLILEAARIGTWEWDLGLDRITWSDNFEELHGFERGAFGRALTNYQRNIHAEDRDRVVDALRACAAGGPNYDVAYRLVAPGDVIHHVEAEGRLVHGADGSVRLMGVCRDVSEQVHLRDREHQALLDAERSARQYYTLAQEIPAHVWTATPDGSLDFVNDRVVRYFGKSAEEIIGAGWQGVIHPADLGDVIKRWTHSLSTGEPYEIEFRLRRADGAYRWYLGRALPIRDASGVIVHWLGTNTDIDDKKRALALTSTQIEVAELLVNARRLEDVATLILETISRNLGWTCSQLWIVDRKDDVLRRSAGWCDTAALPTCDFDDLAAFEVLERGVGLPGRIWETREPAWIADLEIDPNFPRAAIMKRIGLKSGFGFPLIVTGEVSAVLELFSAERRIPEPSTIELAGAFGNQIGHFIERQSIEQHLSETLQRLNRLQNVTDAALSHLSLNELLDDLLGRICQAVAADIGVVYLLDREKQELYPVATVGGNALPRDIRIPVSESRVATDRTTVEIRHVSSDPAIRPEIKSLGIESIVSIPLLTSNDLIGVLFVGAFADKAFETEETHFMELVGQRLANAIVNSAMYEDVRESNRVKDRFISVASHELRTPMTGILGWTSILRTESDPDIKAEALDWIEKSVKTQAQLVEDLLDSTRIREGKLELRRETIDLRDAVSGALRTCESQAAERGVALDVSLPEHPVEVVGDRVRLQQVAWNLIGNAIKFTPAGKRVMTSVSVADGKARLTVADEGEGIHPEFLPNVFKAFEQDNKGRQSGGLGLGLHIVSTIVQRHGGTIEAHSDGAGKGARFDVTLPMA